jgi:rod shape-determining protein MreC
MDTIFSRYRNLTILAAVLFAQVVMLGYQVKVPHERGPVRLARVWVLTLITPMEKAVVHTQERVSNTWQDYVWLRGVRQENDALRDENEKLRLEQIRLAQDAAQARRLQSLLAFKEQTVSQTVAAQVIGSSGTETSRVVTIDKGIADGVKADAAVVTPEGVVGKVLKVFDEPTMRHTAQVLLLTDPSSGVGGILENSRLQGIVRGTQAGELLLQYVMSDEKVTPGERVMTSGGDRVFPKGMPLGTVTQVSPGADLFLNIRVKPAAQLSRLEEVLVITRIAENVPAAGEAPNGPVRAADVLALRLPTVAAQPPAAEGAPKKSDPPSFAEWLRQQKAAQAAAAKQANGGAGSPPATKTPNPAAPKNANGEPASPPATVPATKAPSSAPKGSTAVAPKKQSAADTSGTQTTAPQTSSPQTAAPNKSAPKKQPETMPPANPATQPPATPPGVTL